MIISRSHRFVYYSMPKAASTTVSDILVKKYGGQPCFDRHDNRFLCSTMGYFHFTTVRNPYERAISAYKHSKPKPEDDIDSLFQRFHFVSMTNYLKKEFAITYNVYVDDLQTKFMTGRPGPGTGIHRLRVENLDNEFSQLPFVKREVSLGVLNESASFEVSHETIDKIKQYVNANYQEDFETFGYQMIS